MPAKVTGLVPMAHVADVQRSVTFYEHLGFKMKDSLTNKAGKFAWAFIESEHAELMFALASDAVIAPQQAVLFYLYTSDLSWLRQELLALNIKVSPVTYPEYMPAGEVRIEDPDGYVLLVGQRN